MHSVFRQHFKEQLVRDMERINGTQFEYMCKPVMEIITGSIVTLDGHNLYLKPVGYTADLRAETNCVGQCGTEIKYFEGDRKPYDDVKSCLKDYPCCKTIYLFSNQEASGGKRESLESNLHINYSRHTILVYDARKIADVICNNIEKDEKMSIIFSYLSVAKSIYDLHVANYKCLSLTEQYIHRPEEAEIIDKIKKRDTLQIYGPSGIGKTQIVNAVIQTIRDSYHFVIWITDLDDYKENQLASIEIYRGGKSINLQGILQQMKTLVIVDNMNKNVPIFVKNFNENNRYASKCIITSLQKNLLNQEDVYELGCVRDEIAHEILYKLSNPTKEECQVFLSRIKGFPLLIELAAGAVESGDFSWGEINDFAVLSDIEDRNRNVTFAERVLGRLVESCGVLFNELVVFDSIRLSYDYLYSVDNIKLKKLENNAIIKKNGHFCYIHILLLDAVKNLMKTKYDANRVLANVNIFFNNHLATKDLSLYSFVTSHRIFLEEKLTQVEKNCDLYKNIVYSLVCVCNTHLEPQKYLRLIEGIELNIEQSELDLRLFIEKCEIEAACISYDDKEGKKTLYRNSVDKLIQSNIPETFEIVAWHHIGKWLGLVDEESLAISYYDKILCKNQDAYPTLLQYAKLSVRLQHDDKAKELAEKLMSAVRSGRVLQASIALSCYEMIIRSEYLQELRAKHVDADLDRLRAVLVDTMNMDGDLLYSMLEKMSGYLAYNHPAFFKELFTLIPQPYYKEAHDTLKFSYARICLNVLRYSNCNDEERQLIISRISPFLAIAQTSTDNQRKILIDLYHQMSDDDRAIEVYNTCDDKEEIFLCQSMAKIYLNLDKREAIRLIDISLSKIDSIRNSGQKASIWHDKAVILKELKDPACFDCYEKALKLQTNTKSVEEWQKELAMCRESFAIENE